MTDTLRWEMFVYIETYSEKYFWHVSVPVSYVRWYMYMNMYISLCDINNDERCIIIFCNIGVFSLPISKCINCW